MQEKDWQRQLLQLLREATLDYGSGIKESLKYKIPFYSRNHHLIFLNVPSKKDIVQVGFYWGALLSRDLTFLESNDKKQIRHLSFKSVENFEDRYDEFNQAMIASIELDDKILAIKKLKIPITKILKGEISFE